ncbi:MAG: nucleotide sugar dehydrogenase [Methanobacteriota archaeon]|nr:MAG: nucleotide sugar dehydrogenase [Euryarchaeota archaeon]
MQIRKAIESSKARIGVVGLGYVGLPLALEFARKFSVIGYEIDDRKREMLSSGKSYLDDVTSEVLAELLESSFTIAETPSDLKDCDVLIICVPTPVDSNGDPDLSYIRRSSEIAKEIAHRGMLIILESTSYPGTTEEFLGTAIKDAGLKPGVDVALAFSPERVDPGNTKYNIRNTPKVVGGVDRRSTEVAAALYSTIVEAGVISVNDCRTAEATKIVENIFRGVNIALINELALVFEKMNINTWDVVRAASTKPFAFLAHYPGPGVGGHCIPLDPLYLSFKARQYGIEPRFVELSREVNESMKRHTVELVTAALEAAQVSPRSATVAVMGLAYKKNISDTRESPSTGIIEMLSARVKDVVVHDPFAISITTSTRRYDSEPLAKVLESADCLVFITDHDEYTKLAPSDFAGKRVKAIVDTRNLFDGEEISRIGVEYRGIGK